MGYRGSKFEQLNNENWLREKYEKENLSLSAIERIVGCQKGTVKLACKRFNIPIRQQPVVTQKEELKNYDWLFDHYVVQKLSEQQISNLLGRDVGQRQMNRFVWHLFHVVHAIV